MEKKEKKKKPFPILRTLVRILLGLALLLFLLVIFVRSQWGQEIIKKQLISSLSEKTNTVIEVDRLFITFSGDVIMEGLYLEDKQGDTLVYSDELEADIPLWPIIRGKDIRITSLVSSGFKANIIRKDTLEGFNYEFLLEALAPADPTAVAPVDSTAAKRNFIIEEISVSGFDLDFIDDVAGMNTSVEVGTLGMHMEVFDLVNLKFHASKAVLANSEISYVRKKPFPEKVEEEDVPLPYIIADELFMEQVVVHYESRPDGILADMDIADLSLRLPEADLSNNIIDISYFHLRNSEVDLRLTEAQRVSSNPSEYTPEGFTWPAWKIQLNELLLENNDISYTLNSSSINSQQFDPQALDLRNVNLAGKDIFLEGETAGAKLSRLSFRETSGLRMRNSRLNLRVNERNLSLDNLRIDLNDNLIRGDLQLQYASLQNLIDTPEAASITANLPEFHLVLEDLFLFQPELRSNEYMRAAAEKNLSGQLEVQGTLSAVQISSASLNWGSSTSLQTRGELYNVTDPDQLAFNFPFIDMNTTGSDLKQFIEEDSLGIKLPRDLAINGSLSGNPQNMKADLVLNSSQGKITAKGNFMNQDQLAFNAEVQVLELDLGTLLQNDKLGDLSLSLTTSGQGSDLNSLDASLESTVASFSFNGYPITDLEIRGEVEDGRGPIYTQYKDDNLDFEMENFVVLDTVATKINTNLDVIGANLQTLGLTSRSIRVGFGLDASFRGNGSAFDVNAEIVDGVTVYGNKSYLLGDFLLSARVRPDSTALDIVNQLLDVNLRSNADPGSFARALQRHYRSYLSATVETDTVKDPVNLQFHAEIRENPILHEVFFAQLGELDTVDIAVDFRERDRELVADVSFPFLSYMGSEVDSLALHLNSNRQDFNFSFGFKSIHAGPVIIPKTIIDGEVAEKILHVNFNSFTEGERLYHLQSEITRRSDTVTLRLNPSEVLVNGELWEVPESNLIRVSPNWMAFEDFRLTRNGRSMEITDDRPDVEKEHIALSFDNFDLASFFAYFNPAEPLATGNLNGNLTVEDPFGSKGLIADLEINTFEVLEVPMGILRLDAEAVSFNDYNFALAIKEGKVDLDLTGGFTAAADGAEWYTQLDMNRVEMEIIEAFSFGEIKNSKGSFSGNMELTGTFAEPEYTGQLIFQDAGFTVSKLNAPFRIRQETLLINTDELIFDQFEVEDSNANVFTMDGKIMTTPLINPEFDLSFSANDFMLLNSTREDNDLFYGKGIFDLQAELTGTLNVPNLKADLAVEEETNLTYIIPESEIGIEQREGVVRFVNREDPNAILTAREQETYALSGIEINSQININENAIFNVIIDEQTGDNLQVVGEGELLFNIFSNGRMTLSGIYEMSGGYYDMNLYGLVNRTFEIVDGSTITWSGDPLDAHLDLRASYTVETSASDLMAPRTSGSSSTIQSRFRQEMPFIVYLDIGGELMQPVLHFGLDMPEDEQGAVGGQVYGRVQQINQQEQELNQQVFSLLVLNRFYPSSGSDGTGGGTINIARDNLNEALSDQLNIISQNIIGEDSDFAIDFGLDTYTDYQGESPRERTQLDIAAERSFMDDRLVARVGSEVDLQGSAPAGEETPLIGNVSLEYLIEEDGTWRIRGFRSNRFENVIEGQVIVSGLALIFQKEFNKFRELFEEMNLVKDKGQNNDKSK